jgi:hypothetical protein
MKSQDAVAVQVVDKVAHLTRLDSLGLNISDIINVEKFLTYIQFFVAHIVQYEFDSQRRNSHHYEAIKKVQQRDNSNKQ